MSIEEKRSMFSTRNWMVDIADNFGKKEKCFCGEDENMSHVYMCE